MISSLIQSTYVVDPAAYKNEKPFDRIIGNESPLIILGAIVVIVLFFSQLYLVKRAQIHGETGLTPLERHARFTRRFKIISGLLIISIAISFGIALVPISVGMISSSHSKTYDITGVICAISALVIIFLGTSLLGIHTLREGLNVYASGPAKKKYDPLKKKISEYHLSLKEDVKRYKSLEIPEFLSLKILTSNSTPDVLEFLGNLRDRHPEMIILNLIIHDNLISARRYNEAEKEIAKVLERDDLPEPVRFHFETCLLAAQLGASADDETVARCEAAIDSATEDGLRMWRSIDFASMIITAKHTHRIDQAIKWCELARQIYPYDAAVFLLSALISLEKNDTKSAKADLKSAKEIASESNISKIRAYLAIAAAMDKDPKAAELLDQSLRETLPLPLKERLEQSRLDLYLSASNQSDSDNKENPG